MAILHKSVLGTFTNKVGGVVGSSWKGIPVVRSLPASVANPRSAAQMTQRMRFALMINFAVAILVGWIRPLWNRDAKRMSGFNAFVRANMVAFNQDGDIVLSQLNMARGRLLAPRLVNFNAPLTGDPNFRVQVYSPENDRYATPNDEIYLLVWDVTTQRVVFSGGTGIVRGTTTAANITIYTEVSQANIAVFAAYRHPRGIFTSGATYFSSLGSAIISPTSEFLFEFAKIMKIDTSNIDTNLVEAEAVAVLKSAIKEKAATKKIKIESDGDLNIIPVPDKHPYEPVIQEIEAYKDVEETQFEEGEFSRLNPQSKRGMTRGNK